MKIEAEEALRGDQVTPRIPSPPGPAYNALIPSLSNPKSSGHDPGKFPGSCQTGFSSYDSQSCKAPVANVNSGPFAS